MKPSTELFDLIKSLTGSEKRYFKLSVSFQQGNKDYLKLFEAIDSQKVYDEKEIRLKFKKEKIVKNITFTKNYLYKLIFKSLNSFNEEKSIDSKLTNILNRCRILFDKALIQQYFKTVKLGKKLAIKYERFSYLLEFLEIERQLTKKEELSKNDINKIYFEENIVLDKIRNINDYKRAINLLFTIQRTNGVVRSKADYEKINVILSSVNYPDEKKAMSVTALETYYFSMHIASEIKGDHEKAYLYSKKRFQIINSHREVFQNSLFDNYKDSYLIMISAASNAGRYREAGKLYKEFMNANKKTEKQDSINIAFTHFGILLNYAIHTENKKDFADHAPILEKYLLKYKNKITINTYNIFYYNLSKYYFATGDFNEALRTLNALFDSRHLKFSPFIEPYVRMLNILIHYELRNYKLMNYLISSVAKYLKSKNKYYKTECAVLKYMKKFGNDKIKTSELIGILNAFFNGMNSLKESEFEKNAFFYLDYSIWLKKKITFNS